MAKSGWRDRNAGAWDPLKDFCEVGILEATRGSEEGDSSNVEARCIEAAYNRVRNSLDWIMDNGNGTLRSFSPNPPDTLFPQC